MLDRTPGPLAVFVAVAVVYIATGTYGGNVSRDTLTASVAAWALGVHHTLNLSFIPLAHGQPSVLELAKGAHGWLISDRFPGAVLLATPFYAIAGGGYGPIPGTLAAALAAAGATAVLYKVLCRLESRRVALLGTALFAFATSNWTVSGRELWEHPGAELVIALGMLALINRRFTLSGLAFGAAILFRPHLGIGVLAVGLGILWMGRRWLPVLSFGLGAVPGLAAYLAWNWVAYGHFTIIGGYSDVVNAGGVGVPGFLENLAGTLVSPERGVLICSPILLVAILGLRPAWRTSSGPVRVFALAGLAYLASQLALIRFSGGDGFVGYRTCLETLMWCAPLLVRAGALGVKRVGAGWTWALAALSVSFYAAAAFVQGETNAIVNPWTHWAPILVAQQYGVARVVLGAVLGMGGVFAAWGLMRARGNNYDTTGQSASATDKAQLNIRADRYMATINSQ